MNFDKTASFNDGIQTVLGLADSELCSLYAVARRDGDKELEAQADAADKALAMIEPLLKVAPDLLEALDYLLRETIDQDLKYGITLTEGEEDARQNALAVIAKVAV